MIKNPFIIKNLFTFISIALFATSAVSQPIVHIPKIELVAEITGTNVNLRQGHSATSPLLMEMWEGDGRILGYGLKATANSKPVPFHLNKGEILPVMEQGTPGNWVSLCTAEYPSIMTKFCKLIPFSDLKIKAPTINVAKDYSLPLMQGTGKYSSFIFRVVGNEGEDYRLQVGTIVDNIEYYFVSVAFGSGPDENLAPNTINCTVEDNMCVIGYGRNVATVCALKDEYTNCIDFSKLSEEQYAAIIDKLSKDNHFNTLMSFTLVDGKECNWMFDWNNDGVAYYFDFSVLNIDTK